MAGIGVAPCRTMAAEDIRDLQRWTGHGRRRYAGGRTFLLLPGLLRGWAALRALVFRGSPGLLPGPMRSRAGWLG